MIVALLASFPFGATAFVTLSSLGGSSPLIFTLFTLIFLASVALRRHFVIELQQVMRRDWMGWLLVGLLLYTVFGAYLLPRMFIAQTSVVGPGLGFMQERPLFPVAGNITQPAYFTLGIFSSLALAILLTDPDGFPALRTGFLAWAGLHVTLGAIDFLAKMAGAGDILEPIRTASYTMMTNAEEAGFSRVTGAYSEASSFGGGSLISLAFTFVYWRETGSRTALYLALATFLLLLAATSSSAYVALAIVTIPVCAGILYRTLIGHSLPSDITVVAFLAFSGAMILAAYIYDPRIFEPFIRLFESMILNKAASPSGQERSYWNALALKNVFDTSGIGIGMGSSRTSSWPLAVISQLGLIGSAIMAFLLLAIVRGVFGIARTGRNAGTIATVLAIRASALTALIGSSIAGSAADPGQLFFIALAAIMAVRAQEKSARTSNERTWRHGAGQSSLRTAT